MLCQFRSESKELQRLARPCPSFLRFVQFPQGLNSKTLRWLIPLTFHGL